MIEYIRKRILVLALAFFLASTYSFGQKILYGIGAEICRTDFVTRSPSVSSFNLPYKPSIGYIGQLAIEYRMVKYVNFLFKPSFGVHKMSINGSKTAFLRMDYINLCVGSRLDFEGLTAGFEVGMSRYLSLYLDYSGNMRDLENSIINKNLGNISFFAGFNLIKESLIYIKAGRHLNDYFVAEGIDNVGRAVSPIYVQPKFVSLGMNFYINMEKNTKVASI
ncbi:MAG: hypothetical protein U0T36_09285 [Saprospiraceae bacterium]